MKRLKLKLVLTVCMALCMLALYLLSCFPVLKTVVFSWDDKESNPVDVLQENDGKNNILAFELDKPVVPEIPDYIIVSITAKNVGDARYPYGSIAVNLSGERAETPDNALYGNDTGGDNDLSADSIRSSNTGLSDEESPVIYKIQERTRIFVDGLKHSYCIPVGENKYWRYEWSLDGPILKGQIRRFEIEVPEIEGVDIEVNSVTFNKRLFFAADSHVNYFFKSYLQLSHIGRFLTPAYIFLALFAVFFPVFWFLLESKKYIGTGGPGLSIERSRVSILMVPLLLLVIFSFYFMGSSFFTVKGYWDSYRQQIIKGQTEDEYYGFSDFKEFVSWVNKKVPEGSNIIVLVKGQPVYIMAQMAYGTYPKDIKFIDINGKGAGQVNTLIEKINSNNSSYRYLVVISAEDAGNLNPENIKLIDKYRPEGGFIYFYSFP